jgi:hypothetical protein
MKTTIKVIALVIAAGYPCVAFAEFLGAPVPSIINAESALGLFTAALAVLLMIGDYTRRPLPHTKASYTRTPFRKRESHRLAA